MSDHSMRAVERTGLLTPKLLRERLRAGTLTLPWLKIAAYCGSKAARELVPVWLDDPQHGWGHVDSREFEFWTRRLISMDPDMGTREERCDNPSCRAGRISVLGGDDQCFDCGGTDIRQIPWGSDWLALRCAIVAGRMALTRWEDTGWKSHGVRLRLFPRRALDAAQHYLDIGTLKTREAWHALGFDDTPPWIFGTTTDRAGLISCILATARELGEECKLYPPPPAHYGFCRSCNGVGRIPNEAVIHKGLSNNLVERALR